MRLDYAAISDVGRVRKDNQDSGYVGPHVSPCATAWVAPRAATSPPAPRSASCGGSTTPHDEQSSDLLGQVAGALHRAHDRIGELVDENPALTGTSTTATVALFDGSHARRWATSATAVPTCCATVELHSSPRTTRSSRR